jgi:histidinol-phosphatase
MFEPPRSAESTTARGHPAKEDCGRGTRVGAPRRHVASGLGPVASSVVDSSDDLQLAFDTSDLAADLALAYFESGVSATLKADGTPVTEADRAVERLFHDALSAARPEDALLGEEFGQLGEGDRIWIIDPVDGTSFFSRGDPNWRVHIALEVAGSTELAVVTAPALRRCWWATRGGGSFESSWPREKTESKRLEVSTTSMLAHARLDALDDVSRARLPSSAARVPASPLALVELVRGEIDAFLAECCHIWDHAPWILLVEEAGGRFTDRTGGHAGDQGGGLYSNANLHGQLLAALQYPASP